mgnify:CR=1 FL=1
MFQASRMGGRRLFARVCRPAPDNKKPDTLAGVRRETEGGSLFLLKQHDHQKEKHHAHANDQISLKT